MYSEQMLQKLFFFHNQNWEKCHERCYLPSFVSQESFILSIDHDALTANLHQAVMSIY